MKVVIWKQDRINYIVNGVCEYYKITPQQLFKIRKRPEYNWRKRIAIKLLKDVADISIQEISKVFKVNHPAIYEHYNIISEEVMPSFYGNKEIRREYLNVLEYLGL